MQTVGGWLADISDASPLIAYITGAVIGLGIGIALIWKERRRP